jgi:hypothetical protein
MRPFFSGSAVGDGASGGLSPAARALIADIRDRDARSDVQAPHLAHLTKQGLAAVLDELIRSGEALVLEHGHVLATSTYLRHLGMLESLPAGFHSRDAAALWGCSHGRARATLARMVRDGLVHRSDGAFTLAETDRAR